MQMGKFIERNILIEPSNNMGFIVRIGCGTFVAANRQDLISQLDCYLGDPDRHEREYAKKHGEPTQGLDGEIRPGEPSRTQPASTLGRKD